MLSGILGKNFTKTLPKSIRPSRYNFVSEMTEKAGKFKWTQLIKTTVSIKVIFFQNQILSKCAFRHRQNITYKKGRGRTGNSYVKH